MTDTPTPVPQEHVEDCVLKNWTDAKKIDLWKIPMETYTTSWNQKRKNKDSGVRPGISDSLVFLPADRTKEKKAVLIFVEMKRRRKTKKNGELGASPSTVAPEQLEFLKSVCTVDGVHGGIAYGSTEAIDFIETFLA